MLIGMLGFLMVVSCYLAKRLSDEKTANAALRDRIASLKRQRGVVPPWAPESAPRDGADDCQRFGAQEPALRAANCPIVE